MPIPSFAARTFAVSFRVPPPLVASVLVGSALAGCSQNPFRRSASTGPMSLEPPPGVAAPAATLPQLPASGAAMLPSYTDVDGRQLQATLARSREETQLLQDEIAVLREQLASTSSQLAQSRAMTAGRPAVPGQPLQPLDGGTASMQVAMGQLSLPGTESRFDGNVVRVELPADRLFEGGSASLLPSGTAMLTQAATEIERVFPRHFVGIEAHIDTAPLEQASWGTPHQLTAARAAAVFDFFTTRTSLRQGQLFLVAHGSNHPVVSNATAAGRTRNRRVELVIYPERVGTGDDPSVGQSSAP